MADDIKDDADKQRKKPGPSDEVKAAGQEQEILNDIKDSLIKSSSGLDEGSSSAHLEQISKHVLRIADLQQVQYESSLEDLKFEKDKLEGESAKSLNDSEERREMLSIFSDIRDSLDSLTISAKGGTGASAGGDKEGGFLSGLFGKGGGGTFGIGYAAKGIGVGIAAAAGGIGALLLALAGADVIAAKFGNEGKSLKNVLINLGEGLAGMGTTGLVALGSIFAMSSVLAMFPGSAAVKAGLGIGAFGAGIAAFFFSLGIMEKGLDWMGTDFSGLKPAFANFSAAIGELDGPAIGVLATLLVGSGLLAMLPGFAGAKAGLGMGAIGAGIASFFFGLGLLDAGMGFLDIDGSKLPVLFGNVADAFTAFTKDPQALLALTGLLGAGALFGTVGGPAVAGKAAIGMGMIGAGLGAFFAGLGVGDWALGAMGADGGNLKNIMVNIAEGLSAFTGPQLAGLLAVGGLFAVVSGVPGGVAVAGMAAVGLGIAGLGIGLFIAGMAVGGKVADLVGADGSGMKSILVNMAEGLTAFNQIDGKGLMDAAAGMAMLAPAMILLTTGRVIGAAGELVGDALDWVGGIFSGEGDEEKADQLTELAASLMQFEKLKVLGPAGIAMDDITSSVVRWSLMDTQKISDNAKAAAASFELVEAALIGGMPTLLSAEIPITFKGILNVEGIKETADEVNLLFNSMMAVPSTGIALTAAGAALATQNTVINNDLSTVAPINQSVNSVRQSIQNLNPQDSTTFKTLSINPGG